MEGRGGSWTIKKLDMVRDYLIAYQKVMLNQPWAQTIYIDAFCGAGRVKLRDTREFTQGSALQALGLERPFNQYHFIDQSKAALAKLKCQILTEHEERADRVNYHPGDANTLLPSLLSQLNKSNRRFVIFADPYGMQLDWETIKAVSEKCKADFWLLVPTQAIARLATHDPRKIQNSWATKLDRFLGGNDWRARWYYEGDQFDIFSGKTTERRSASLSVIEDDFQARLRQTFPCVAENRLRLKNGNRLLFTLMFACSNQSKSAHGKAKGIANHLLRAN